MSKTYLMYLLKYFLEHTDLTKFKRQRNRVILSGESCDPVFEEEACQIPYKVCPKYFWVLGSWSHCQLAEGITCGHGLRTRGTFYLSYLCIFLCDY